MPLDFQCPYCGRELSAPDAAASTTGSCRFCGAAITAPSFPGAPGTLVAPGNLAAAETASLGPGAGSSAPTGSIDPGAIVAESWRILTANWGALIGALLLIGLLSLVLLGPVYYLYFFVPMMKAMPRPVPGHPVNPFPFPSGGMSPMRPQPHIPPGAMVAIVFLTLALGPLSAGAYYLVDRLITRGDSNIGAVFHGFRHFGPLLGFTVLYGLPGLAVTGLQAVVGNSAPAFSPLLTLLSLAITAFMLASLRLGLMEVVDRGTPPMEAFRTAWETTKGHRVMILLTYVLLYLVFFAGYLACCVGILFTSPILFVGEVLIYRQLRGLQGTPE